MGVTVENYKHLVDEYEKKLITEEKKQNGLKSKTEPDAQKIEQETTKTNVLKAIKEKIKGKLNTEDIAKTQETKNAVAESRIRKPSRKIIEQQLQEDDTQKAPMEKSKQQNKMAKLTTKGLKEPIKQVGKSTKKTKKAAMKKEDVYNIESLVKKNGAKYLVKWENYPADQNTWEPKVSIPGFILKFYEEDPTRLGHPAPGGSQEMSDEEEEDYEVEKILKKRLTKKGKVEYLVKW